jgi:hypothetical protein
MARIDVVRVRSAPNVDAFRVTVDENGTRTEHEVTIESPPPPSATRFRSLEAFVAASFEFLLEREAKESILSSFEIREIGRYFPEWEEELGDGD